MSSIYEVHIPVPSAGGGPPPPASLDRFAPKYLVGNVPAGDDNVAYNTGGFMYIPDPGDGSGIAIALTQPNGPGDVWLRPGSYSLSTGAPLVVPDNCRLVGAGRALSIISSDTAAGHSQETLVLGQDSELIGIQVNSGAQAAPGAGASRAVVRVSGAQARVLDCRFILDGTARTQPWAIWDATASVEVRNCRFDGNDQAFGNPSGPSVALAMGPDPLVTPNGYAVGSYEISDCKFGRASGLTGFNQWLVSYNASRGDMSDCNGVATRPVGGALSWVFNGTPSAPPSDQCCNVVDTRVFVTDDEDVGDTGYTGVSVTNLVTSLILRAFSWDSVQVIYDTIVSPTIPRTGFSIDSSGNGSIIESASLVGLVVVGHSRGIRIQTASGTSAFVAYVRISASVVVNPQTIGAVVGTGILLTASGANSTRRIGIVNCSVDGAPAGCFGINIATAGVLDTMVVSNTAVAAGGTAIQDLGTGTNSADNIT